MKKILVVDDEPDVRELFNITLTMAGFKTDTAKDGMDAVGKLAGDIPDLILLDLMMPRMNGFGFLDHVRQNLETKPVRVLVATAKVLEDADQEKLGSWPVVGVLNKGELDIGQMVTIVNEALTKDATNSNGSKAEETKNIKEASKAEEEKKAPETANPSEAPGTVIKKAPEATKAPEVKKGP